LLEYWAIIVHRRWVIVLTVVTFLVIGLVGTYTTQPKYRATTTLHIERKNPDIFTFQDLGQSEVSWTAYADFYQTQYNIMSSPTVARRAAQRLEWTSKPAFVEKSKPGLFARLRSLIPRSSPTVAVDPLEAATGQILAGMEVRPESRSQLVHLSWVSTDPLLARDVTNAMAAAYISYNIESQFATTDQAQDFLVDQIARLKIETAAIESELQDYGEAKRILSLDDSNNVTLSAVNDIARRRTAAQTNLAETEANWRAMRQTEPTALPEVMESPLIVRLRQEYAVYEAEFTEKSRRFKDDWPGMQVLRSKLDQARERLDLEIERIAVQVRAAAKTQKDAALEEVKGLDALLMSQETTAQQLRRDGVEFANLSSEIAKKRDTLDKLRQRQIEMALSSKLKDLDSTSTNIRILEEARAPGAPFSPNPKRNMTYALLLGLLIGGGFAFLLDYLDNTITAVSQLAATTSLPLMAVIPRHRDVATRRKTPGPLGPAAEFDLVAHRDSRSIVAEAFRELRTAILLSNPGEPPRRLMVTSSLPGEGKTATTINLATVLAQLGRRIVVIDTDLRKPRLHKALRIDNRRGVSTFLSGLEQEAQGLIVPTGIDNLDAIPSGPIPPNPSELLDSSRFLQLADDLFAAGYDHILFDSPPALSVSDPVIIASNVDVAILVVRSAKTPRQSIRLAADKFRHSGRGKMGVVLNDVDAERHGASYYRYQSYVEDSGPAEVAGGGGTGD
jgi:capsular exopolysaccharide synthesis family protein